MSRFIVGVFLGCLLGIVGSALAASISGTGTLDGWTVTQEGEQVCSDPEVDTARKEIQCPQHVLIRSAAPPAASGARGL
jgi:hypothetical protein